MARVLITGSTTGLGRAAAEQLIDEQHDVVLHARNPQRARDIADLAERARAVVIGDLASIEQTKGIADQLDDVGGLDAVIHNAAIYVDDRRIPTPDGHARTFAVNVLAPYLLTARIDRARVIYLSSGMHTSGDPALDDLDWTRRRWNGIQAYCDSKLHVTALAFALARRGRFAHAVDPGWVPTRMGGPSAPDDLELGHRTQTWLATTDDPAATRAGYWHHQRQRAPAPAALEEAFQDGLIDELARLTGVSLPPGFANVVASATDGRDRSMRSVGTETEQAR
jgi:NAD(P)-dependent dehydrogenase (short-subunit alcohol dehydrogenase family)